MEIKTIKNPLFLEQLNNRQLKDLSKEIRTFLIDSVANTGGHLSSNLGVVELTIALHKVFNNPKDKIFFDVGHQAYIHKILTGRADQFDTLRQYKGLSGFQKRNESSYDCFEAGHSTTSLSAAVGMAIARDLDNEDYHILPVIGDGALTGGMAYEALNHLGHIQKKVIVILNDNDMSISANVGGLNHFLEQVRISMPYLKAKHNFKEITKLTKVGKMTYHVSKQIKHKIKDKTISNIFTDMGLDYIGPLDGHDFQDLLRGLNKAKQSDKPIIVHVLTKKGKGYYPAESDKSGKWHGIGKFDKKTGQVIEKTNAQEKAWSQVIADLILEQMDKNPNIVTITPAMIGGSKLEKIFTKYPERSFDVGIAESHATMMAAGLGLSGKHPFLSIYSTFSQRAYDQFNHDLARMNLPCVIGLDRSGLVGEDGETHHGVFDIALYRNLPNFVISSPRNNLEAQALVETGFQTKSPFIIRYARGKTLLLEGDAYQDQLGMWQELIPHPNKVIITYGVHTNAFESLINDKYPDKCGLIHARYLKPFDQDLFSKVLKENKEILIYEPDIKGGGFASSLLEYANENKLDTSKITIKAINNEYIEAGNVSVLMKEHQLDYEDVLNNFTK